MLERFSFTRPLQAKDWSRFKAYAPHVRRLLHVFDSFYPPATSPSAFIELSRFDGQLLPKLRSLAWAEEDRNDVFPFIRLFYSTELTQLNIFFGSHYQPEDVKHALSSLSMTSPNLQSIFISELIEDVLASILIAPSTSNSDSNFASLRSLDLSGLDIPQTILLHLSTRTALKSLSLRSSGYDFSSRASPGSFASLQKLTWRISKITTEACSYFRSLRLPQLAEIALQLDPQIMPSQMHDICQFVSTCGSLSSLCIHVFPLDPSWRDEGPQAITLTDIQPLLNLRTLHHLELLLWSFRCDDHVIISFAQAFPAIRQLRLIPPTSNRLTWIVQCTLIGLEALSRGCPQLDDLAVHIDATSAHVLSFFDKIDHASQARNTKLTQLCIGASRVSRPKDTAVILAALFPNLGRIVGWFGWMPRQDPWREVEHFVLSTRTSVEQARNE
ncbi:hypothetical protein HGRIS_012382 [Hohenbuehelia grisea]|uniref:Uncharacterized protein n=1 Tax=Hohenbuehelia grisea TaxID=104357 RepID=A0ABR3IS55_9AGAR